MHELAYGGSSVISYFGPVPNPWVPDYSSGGSSSGSAMAVAAELCYGALGSDTGGSIRQPAPHCGIVGLKPTYGRVCTRGVIPLSWSLDHVGPMTRTVRDAALLLQVMAGYDPEDTASTDTALGDYAETLAVKTSSLRIGIARAPLLRRASPRGAKGHGHRSVRAAAAHLESARGGDTRRQRPLRSPGGSLCLPPGVCRRDSRALPPFLRSRFQSFWRTRTIFGPKRSSPCATRGPSTCSACRRSPFPAVSPGRDCPWACRSRVPPA